MGLLNKNKLVLLTFIVLNTLVLHGQNFIKEIERLTKANQECLDKGQFMASCERSYYVQMDSMLNIVYRHIRKPMNEDQKLEMKKSQLIWLKQRDKEFNRIDRENDGGGQDAVMFSYSDKSCYVIDRINYLIATFIRE
jgi:uncharacterized protein YecT (DUF1311 family)